MDDRFDSLLSCLLLITTLIASVYGGFEMIKAASITKVATAKKGVPQAKSETKKVISSITKPLPEKEIPDTPLIRVTPPQELITPTLAPVQKENSSSDGTSAPACQEESENNHGEIQTVLTPTPEAEPTPTPSIDPLTPTPTPSPEITQPESPKDCPDTPNGNNCDKKEPDLPLPVVDTVSEVTDTLVSTTP